LIAAPSTILRSTVPENSAYNGKSMSKPATASVAVMYNILLVAISTEEIILFFGASAKLQDEFFAVSKQMHDAKNPEEKMKLLKELQVILKESHRVLEEIHKKQSNEK
jgi:hypothetical protein